MSDSGYATVANLSLKEFLPRVKVTWGMVSGTVLGWNVPQKGYINGFFPEQIKPTLDKGWTDTMLHRPHGDDSAATGEPMNEDAAVENRDPAAQDYDEMLAAALKSYPQWTNITYMGSAWDPDFGKQMTRGQWSAFINRKMLSVARSGLNSANNDIAFDHSVTLCEDYEKSNGGSIAGFPPGAWQVSWSWVALINKIKRMQGRKVWLEALPYRAATHYHDYDFVCRTFRVSNGIQSEWERSRPTDDTAFAGFADNDWSTPSQMLKGCILDWNSILGRNSISEYAKSIGDVLARGSQHSWGGSIFYLAESAEQVWRAVTSYAASRVEAAVET